MIDEYGVKDCISELLKKYDNLRSKDAESEKKTEEFLRDLFVSLGWDWLSNEVTPQKMIRSAHRTTKVDYSFKPIGELRPAFYLEAKRFSESLENPEHVLQAINYGKNSGTRWVILTNFARWRIFNSDYFDEMEHAELRELNLIDCLTKQEDLNFLLMFAKEKGSKDLDDYAKKHKKWKESADIEELLTKQLLEARKILSKAIKEQNLPKFDTGQDMDFEIDTCVQKILDRIIFCRMIEDNGEQLRLKDIYERWKGDERVQFYKDFLCPFFGKMHGRYNSTIFDQDRIDRLSIKNEDFMPVLESFYINPINNLSYRFDAIATDILGHAYETYLSWKTTAKKKGIEQEGLFKRKQGGIYYTPEFLVDFLVSSTLGQKLKTCISVQEALKIRVLDPACGSGTFLVRALEEFKTWFIINERKNGNGDFESANTLPKFIDRVLESCIYGIDIDPRAVRLTRLNLFLRAADSPGQLPNLNIIERDSITWDDNDTDNRRIKGFRLQHDFSLVNEAGGFDIVLGNPPWEKWKPDSQEFFEEVEEGFNKLTKQQALKRMDQLFKTRLYIKKAWHQKLEHYEYYSTLYRRNYRFQSTEAGGRKVSGDLDLYKIFTERAYQLCKEGGSVGFLVPSGIYTDLGAKGLRSMLFDNCSLKTLYSFENKAHAIFSDVHASYKFVLLTFDKKGKTESFSCAFFLHTVNDLNQAVINPTVIDIEFIKKSSPTSWSVLEIKTKKDYEIIGKLLKFPPLKAELKNQWNVNIQSGFHMTNDSKLFHTGILIGLPMLEGKNIEQFTHRWKDAPIARYKLNEKDILSNLKEEKVYHTSYWMAWRDVSSSTNRRTAISTIIPPGYVCGNTINIVRMSNLRELCFLCGVIDSFTIDYLIRQKVSAHLNQFSFLETPVPRLSSGKEFDFIVRKVAQLVCTTDEFSELMKIIGIEKGLTKESERAQARAQLDAMVAKIYGLTKEDLAYILTKFPLVDEKQKELVLGEF